MAVDLYFAGSMLKEYQECIINLEANVLKSYYYERSAIKQWIEHKKNGWKGKLFVDSGAFTAWTKGVDINVDEYIKWLNDYKDYIYLAGQIDIIPGSIGQVSTFEEVNEAAQQTYNNYWYMRERLDKPDMLLYTFHVGEPFIFLQRLLEYPNIKYIALGGMVGKNEKTKKNFSQKCFEIIKKSKNPNVKVHAFGITTPSILEKFPFASGDSTGWLMSGSTGHIYSKYGTLDFSRNNRNTVQSVFNLSNDCYKIVVEEVERFGYTMEQLESDYKARICYNAKYLYKTIPQIELKSFKIRRRLFS